MIVVKIGGSCLSTKGGIRRTVEIVEKLKEKPILVVSAFRDITDELATQAANALKNRFDFEKIKKPHYGLIEDLSPSMKAEVQRVKALLNELQELLLGVGQLKDLSPHNVDRILAYGEKLASEIVAAYLIDSGFEARALWDSEAGIITNSNFGNASILNQSAQLVKKRLDTRYIPVVAGFFGKDEKGRIATLGRGGSDYTATFIAAALNCEVILFKDVQGLMTADPKIVETASVIEKINYSDALEMARYGSKVVFEKAIMPAMRANIPIKITSFHKPNAGTTICSEGEATAISSLAKVVKLKLSRPLNPANMCTCLLSKLSVFDVYPLLLTKASCCEISLVMKVSDAEIARRITQKIDKNLSIEVERGLGLVAVIGSRPRKKGSIASVSKFLSEKEIDVDAIDAHRRKLCAVVDEKCVINATRVLHDLFTGSKTC